MARMIVIRGSPGETVDVADLRGETAPTMSSVQYEVCVEGASGVRAATEGGAHRIELCAGRLEGGLTPGPGTLAAAAEVQGAPPIVVLVRPRGGDFIYDRDERRSLEADVFGTRVSTGSPSGR